MEDKVQVLLNEVIEKDIRNLSNLDAGSEARSKAVEELKNLHEMRIEEAKIEQGKVNVIFTKEDKEAQLKSQAFDRWVNIGVQVGLAIGGWVAYDVWYRRGLRFEETGSITSPMTRNLLSRLIPKK